MNPTSLPVLINAGRFAAGRDVGWHTHPGHELVLVTEGECSMLLGKSRLRARAGTVFVCPAMVPQFQETHGFARTSYAVFGLPSGGFDTTERTIVLPEGSPVLRWMDDLYEARTGVRTASDALCSGLLLAIIEHLRASEVALRSAAVQHPALTRAVQLIESRADLPLVVPALAASCHVSASYLSELFQERFGCGPHRFHQKLRLERAARLLESPYTSVSEVARACGYDDANYFTRQFQKEHGLSPAAFRKRFLSGG